MSVQCYVLPSCCKWSKYWSYEVTLTVCFDKILHRRVHTFNRIFVWILNCLIFTLEDRNSSRVSGPSPRGDSSCFGYSKLDSNWSNRVLRMRIGVLSDELVFVCAWSEEWLWRSLCKRLRWHLTGHPIQTMLDSTQQELLENTGSLDYLWSSSVLILTTTRPHQLQKWQPKTPVSWWLTSASFLGSK